MIGISVLRTAQEVAQDPTGIHNEGRLKAAKRDLGELIVSQYVKSKIVHSDHYKIVDGIQDEETTLYFDLDDQIEQKDREINDLKLRIDILFRVQEVV